MTNTYRKVFGGNTINVAPQLLDSNGAFSPAGQPPMPLPLPLPPSGSATGIPTAPSTFQQAVAASPIFDRGTSNDSHTVMIGGVPCVFRRGYGDI